MRFKILCLVIISFILLFSQRSKGNNFNIIELAISYDKSYADKVGGTNQDVENRIRDLIAHINNKIDIWSDSDFDIYIHPVRIEYFGDMGDLSGQGVTTSRISSKWAYGDNLCYKRDMVLHLTGSILTDNAVLGESTGANVCVSNNTDYFPYDGGIRNFAIVVKYSSFYSEAYTITHEMLHTLGLQHELQSYCDQYFQDNEIPIMCASPTGGFDTANSILVLSTGLRQQLESDLAQKPCLKQTNFVYPVECSDVLGNVDTDLDIGLVCGEGWKYAKLTIKNDHTARIFKKNRLIFQRYDELGLSQNVLNLPCTTIPSTGVKICTLPDINLAANEIYEFYFEINYDEIVTDISPNPGNFDIAFFSFQSQEQTPRVPDLTGYFDIQVYPQDRSIVLNNNANSSVFETKKAEIETEGKYLPPQEFHVLINGTFIIDQNLFLDKRFKIKMTENARIKVVNGSTFEFHEGTIEPCGDERWDHIWVENGSSLYFNGVKMRKGTNGIITQNDPGGTGPRSIISLINCTLEDFSENGITVQNKSYVNLNNNHLIDIGNTGFYVEGKIDNLKLAENFIENADFGVFIKDCTQYLDIKGLNITNANTGIGVSNTMVDINECITANCDKGIVLTRGHGSSIRNNTLGYSNIGIQLWDNTDLTIVGNTIGTANDFGNSGIKMMKGNFIDIDQNHSILAKRYGVWGSGVDFNLRDNPDISVDGGITPESGGVTVINGFGCKIERNLIFASEAGYGIESNNNHNNFIWNNTISTSGLTLNDKGTAAIRTVGSVADVIKENTTYSLNSSHGILAQNSTGGNYNCNYINDAGYGMVFLHNAESQSLTANHMVSCRDKDLVLRSVIGDQIHNGNKFYGGWAKAYLTPIEILQSRFIVNENNTYHMPTHPDPALNWFEHEPGNDLLPCNASGSITIYDDPVKLCDHYQRMKNLYVSNRKLYFLKVLHILRYQSTKPGFVLPDCIKLDPYFIDICGLREIADVISRVSRINQISQRNIGLISSMEQFRIKRESYQNAVAPTEKENLLTELNATLPDLRTGLEQEETDDRIELQRIKADLIRINCTDDHVILMKKVWMAYIDILLQEYMPVASIVDPEIESAGRLCSDEYGDVVHLARSIANMQGSTTYFDHFDGCMDDEWLTPRAIPLHMPVEFKISPNPSTGKIEIRFSGLFSGTVHITNSAGRTIFSKENHEIDHLFVTLAASGVYYVTASSADGSNTRKIVITK